MKATAGTLYQRVTNFTLATVLAMTAAAALVPFLFTQSTGAASTIIYDALPSVTPSTNHASLGYQATSTSEFGDSIHLGGDNRLLDGVTVTFSNWAKYSTYASNPSYGSTGWTHPITVNVYDDELGSNGAPTTLLASSTQTISIPWRPESDPSCAPTSNGNGWKEGDTCYNFSGIAFNATFDFSSQGVALPDDVIVSVAYNTQSYGTSPIGAEGPYNSLNVAVPTGQSVSVGSDDDTDSVFWKTSHGAFYSDGGAGGVNVLREDGVWTPNGTVALQITADVVAGPVLTGPEDGAIFNDADLPVAQTWNAVTNATEYIYERYAQDPAIDDTALISETTTSTQLDIDPATTEGTFWWRVKAVVNGNDTGWSEVRTFTIDNTDPIVDITTPTNGASFGNGAVVGIDGSIGDAVSYQLLIGGVVVASGATFDGYNWNTAALASGTYEIQLIGTDAAGNSAEDTISVVIDNDDPSVLITNVSADSDAAIIRGTAEPGSSLTATFNGQTFAVANNAGNWVFTVDDLANGTYGFTVTATDAYGNQTTQTSSVIIDVRVPFVGTLPIASNPPAPDDEADVEGATTEGDVEGVSDNAAAIDTDSSDGTVFGLAWYWWLLIIAALGGLTWWIVAALRRRGQES